MHNAASVLENDTHKLQWDFDTQMDPLILVPVTGRDHKHVGHKKYSHLFPEVTFSWNRS